MDKSRYLDTFIAEANEHLQSLNHYLLELEELEEDYEQVNKLFRAAHSLKGMSGAMNFELLVELTHELENTFDLIRKQKIEINTELIDILFRVVDQLEIMINQVKEQGEIESTSIESEVRNLATGLNEITTCYQADGKQKESLLTLDQKDKKRINQNLKKEQKCWQIKVILSEELRLISARAFIIIDSLQDDVEIIKSNPKLAAIKDGKLNKPFFELIISTSKSKAELKSRLLEDREVVEIEFKKSFAFSKQGGHDFNLTSTVRVDVGKLDELMNLVGELMINKSQIMELNCDFIQPQQKEALENTNRVTNKLHRIIMNLRMISLSRVINRFPRMVRDLAKEMEKKVKLEIEGQETELDRVIIEELGDPLVHLLRNCIDHGIAKPKKRIEKGKSEEGTISIIASQRGNEVKIMIADDGMGINSEVIKEKAIQKGVITEAKAKEMKKNEIIDLIFTSGFTTSQEVTDISGRGVGLDIVRSTIESLGGQIRVKSKVEKGTKFIISLPLTSAIIEALLIRLGEETYALPLNFIDEVYDVSIEHIKRSQGEEFIMLGGEIVHLISLRKRLNLELPRFKRDKEEICVVIISDGDRKIGLVVDELIEQQKVIVKSLNGFLSSLSNVSGATILSNGEVALILNVKNIA